MKKISVLNFILLILFTNQLQSDTLKSTFTPNYTFKDISINYLDWSSKTEKESPQKDFTYLEFEAGAGFNWGYAYMFLDIENPTKSYSDPAPDNLRVSFKPVLDIKLFDSNFYFRTQDYSLTSDDFYVHNFVNGISYRYDVKNFWIMPFAGIHYQNSTYYSGFNGYMVGYTFLYNFTIINQDFSIFQWHETTFSRDKEDGYSGSGNQGALSFWYKINKTFTTGLQYRYADKNLGYDGYQDSVIYSLKFYF